MVGLIFFYFDFQFSMIEGGSVYLCSVDPPMSCFPLLTNVQFEKIPIRV